MKRGPRRTLLALALVAGLCALVEVPADPACNWDVIGYAGVAYQGSGLRGQSLLQQTYADVRGLCAKDWELLTEADALRRSVATSPAALEGLLPFYRGKLVYGRILTAVARAGASPAIASFWLSRIAYLAIAVLTTLWLTEYLGALTALATGWLLVSIPAVFALATLSTPDALSVTMLVASGYAFARWENPVAALALGLAGIAVRPDNVVWVVVLAGFVALDRRRRTPQRAAGAVAGALGVIAYLLVVRTAGSYGWVVQIQQDFVQKQLDPAAAREPLGVGRYLFILLRSSSPDHQPALLLVVTLLGAIALYARTRFRVPRDRARDVLVVALAYVGLHWLAYPSEDRLLIAGYLAILIAATATLVAVLPQRLQQLRMDSPEPAVRHHQ